MNRGTLASAATLEFLGGDRSHATREIVGNRDRPTPPHPHRGSCSRAGDRPVDPQPLGTGRDRDARPSNCRWSGPVEPRRSPAPDHRARGEAAPRTRGRSKLGAPRMPPAATAWCTSAPAAAEEPAPPRGGGGGAQSRVALRSRRPRRAAPPLAERKDYRVSRTHLGRHRRTSSSGARSRESGTTTQRPAPSTTGPSGPASSGEPSSPSHPHQIRSPDRKSVV